MTDNTCLQTISNITEECAYAYFDKKNNLEDELTNINEKKSFVISSFIITVFFMAVFFTMAKENYVVYSGTAIFILIMGGISFFAKKYYSKTKALKSSLCVTTIKQNIFLTDAAVSSLLEETQWSEKELYIIGRCLKANCFTYLDVIEIKESVATRFYHEEKLREWSFSKNKSSNISDITQITKNRQLKTFEKMLRMKGYKIAV